MTDRSDSEWRVSHVDLNVGGHRITREHRSEETARQEVRDLRALGMQLGGRIQNIRLERRMVGDWEEVDDA